MDRREFLWTGSAAALSLPFLSTPGLTQAASGTSAPGDAALNALFDAIFQEQVRNSPAFATQLGLDKGELTYLKSKLDTRPFPQARAEDLARNRKFLRQLNAVNAKALSPAAALNREIVIYDIGTNITAPEKFDLDSVQSPYLISQQDGAYFSIPDFLNSAHTIETTADAEAYLSRLRQFATVLDNETDEQRRQAARGYVAPGWSLDLALGQMRELRKPAPEKSTMVDSIVSRARAKGLAGDWQKRASLIVAQAVYPALDRQIALVEKLRATTPAGDGAWRIPRGDEIYAAALAQATTTNFTPDQVHQIGLEQVADLTAQLDTLLKAAGYTKGTVGERLQALNKDPSQLYPESDAGRVELIKSLNAGVTAMSAKLPNAFASPPPPPPPKTPRTPEIKDR